MTDEAAPTLAIAAAAAAPIDLAAIQSERRAALHRYLNSVFFKPDLEALDIIFAACRAHFFKGAKPVWLWVVGLSGTGKTDAGIQAISGIPLIREMGQFSPRALISAKRGQQGILFKLEHQKTDSSKYTGVLVWKDFTTFLSMRREERSEVMAQFREIADGRWVRDTGERSKQEWAGKVSIIAACTYSLEIAWSVNRTMGDRFVSVQWRDSDDESCANRAQEHDGREDEISATVRSLGATYFGAPSQLDLPPPVPSSFVGPLTQIALLSCWMRRAVHRDEYTRKIDDVPPREKPTRLVKSLRTVLAGHAAIQCRQLDTKDLRLAYRVAMDSVPNRRFRIIDCMTDDTEFSFSDLMVLARHARSTLQRDLEELEEIGILTICRREVDGAERTFAQLTSEFSVLRTSVLCLFL